jgi:transcriptional regulator with XRE-family HTH domain
MSPDELDVVCESALATAQATVCNAIKRAGISRTELARRMGIGPSYVSRVLGGSHNLTIKTFSRAMAACGYELDFFGSAKERRANTDWYRRPIGK